MKISVSIAKKILKLILGERLPKSELNNLIIDRMIEDEVLEVKVNGAKRQVYANNANGVENYLKNNLGINNLKEYIDLIENKNLTRGQAVKIASDSKTKKIRTFKGFCVNCAEPVNAMLHNKKFSIKPYPGIFTYIYDYTNFIPDKDLTIVGVENSENFRYVENQTNLFKTIKPLFVSRYPQNNDLIKWLKSIPNDYLHFGDFDFEGIRIYLNEYKVHLKDRADFFIPDNLENLLKTNGNRKIYNLQLNYKTEQDLKTISKKYSEDSIIYLCELFHKHKKCLEQEILCL